MCPCYLPSAMGSQHLLCNFCYRLVQRIGFRLQQPALTSQGFPILLLVGHGLTRAGGDEAKAAGFGESVDLAEVLCAGLVNVHKALNIQFSQRLSPESDRDK